MPLERAESLFQEIAALPQGVVKRRLWPRIVAFAASMALIVSGVYFFNYRNDHTNAGLNTTVVQDVKPGKVGATLTLANGKKIRLDDAVNGDLANEAGKITC